MKHETWIVLLRGINVGGKNKLRMKEFVALLETLGFVDIKTYIQSGNVVFRGPKGTPSKLATTIASAIEETFDFRPSVIALTKEAFEKAAAANPFPEAEAAQDGKTLHAFFLEEAPRKVDAACLDAVKIPSERWHVIGSVFYLHAPEGFGTLKLATKAERCLGVSATARNWRTVGELLKLAENQA